MDERGLGFMGRGWAYCVEGRGLYGSRGIPCLTPRSPPLHPSLLSSLPWSIALVYFFVLVGLHVANQAE